MEREDGFKEFCPYARYNIREFIVRDLVISNLSDPGIVGIRLPGNDFRDVKIN